jgi:hypothetical protein
VEVADESATGSVLLFVRLELMTGFFVVQVMSSA